MKTKITIYEKVNPFNFSVKKHLKIMFLVALLLSMTNHSRLQFEGAEIATASITEKGRGCNPQADSLALVAFFETTNGANWHNSWNLEQPMGTWFGVTLNSSGCVMCLDLDGDPNCSPQKNGGNNVVGSLIDLQLPNLEHLFLTGNQLTGEIPDFTSVPHLLTLQLGCNKLTGAIPNFTDLSNLTSLELDYNKLTGELPDFDNMPRLENLYVLNNQLSGTLPSFQYLPKLQRLYLHNNQFSGVLPDFSKNMDLQRLIALNNHIESRMPDLSHIPNLTHLNFTNNKLWGELPELGFMKQLRSLMLGKNNFKNTLPDLSGLSMLIEVDFSHNQLEGAIPNFSESPHLKTILLNDNNFDHCPMQKNAPNLAYFNISGNALTFDDLQPNKSYLSKEENYTRQSWISQDTLIEISEGTTYQIQLGIDSTVSDNVYHWYRDGTLIADAEKKNALELKNFKRKNEGAYYCQISNPSFPGLNITSRTVHLKMANEAEPEAYLIPLAGDDEFYFKNSSEIYEFNIVANDELEGIPFWRVELLKEPEAGYVEDLGNGSFEFHAPPGFAGRLEMTYKICNADGTDLCSEGIISLQLEDEIAEFFDFFVPEGFSPNGDLVNDFFKIPELETHPDKYPNNELIVFDKQGQMLYQAQPYLNNWEGIVQQTGDRKSVV